MVILTQFDFYYYINVRTHDGGKIIILSTSKFSNLTTNRFLTFYIFHGMKKDNIKSAAIYMYTIIDI